jgi:hypothetical protein
MYLWVYIRATQLFMGTSPNIQALSWQVSGCLFLVLIFYVNIKAYPDKSLGALGLYPREIFLAQVLILDINIQALP